MLTIHQVSKSFNLNTILNQISFSVMGGERVGLIGPNGVGKSTLLRIIAGHEEADSGQIILTPSSTRIGYLAQGFEFDPDLSVEELIASVAEDPALLEASLAELGTALAAEPDRDDLQDAFDATVAKLSRIDAGRRQQLLNELGLGEIDLGQPAGYLSGGQKTRLSLALLLLDEPDLLLLDEPTNHLDIEMLEWLEEWLHGFNGALLAVSHDRTFLDEVVTTIIDIDPESHGCKSYAGGYSAYIEAFQADLDRQWTAYREQTVTIRRMRQDINRTFEQARSVERSTTPRQPNVRRLAKKVAKKAKSREKKLDRYIDSDERVEKPKRSWQMKLSFDEERHIGRDVLFIENLSVGYADHLPLLTNLNLTIQAGERVILSGANGSGKTSLLRTVMEEIPPQNGAIRLGGSVIIGYMSQEQELLDDQLTAVETIEKHAASAMNETDIRSFLHFFLFKDDAPTRLIRELSFGERSRLALATLVARGCTFLVLDEPINHLDIPSRTRFEQALQSYEGTILAVVHDRFFIHQFATKIWEVKSGKITVSHR